MSRLTEDQIQIARTSEQRIRACIQAMKELYPTYSTFKLAGTEFTVLYYKDSVAEIECCYTNKIGDFKIQIFSIWKLLEYLNPQETGVV